MNSSLFIHYTRNVKDPKKEKHYILKILMRNMSNIQSVKFLLNVHLMYGSISGTKDHPPHAQRSADIAESTAPEYHNLSVLPLTITRK